MLENNVVCVALDQAHEVILHGVASMLRAADARIRVISSQEQRSGMTQVDLTLIDITFRTRQEISAVADALVDPFAGDVVLLTWEISPQALNTAINMGCRGCITKSSSGPEMAAAIRSIQRGEVFVSATLGGTGELEGLCLDAECGVLKESLSRRESEIIYMITCGYSNIEIAHFHYLSINTVKSYIRSAYSKIGVQRRSEAVRWGIEHDLHRRSPAHTTPLRTLTSSTMRG